MAIPWPRKATWPTPLRDHATNLSAFAHEVLNLIERNASKAVPADNVGDIIRGSLTFVIKMQHTPDLSAVSDALRIAQTEAKVNAGKTEQALAEIKNKINNTIEIIQKEATNREQNGGKVEAAGAAAKEATEVGRNIIEITRKIKNRRAQQQTSGQTTYAAVVARNLPPADTYNRQIFKTASSQTQREVVVNIRDPLTIQSLQAMNSSNLKAHVKRAINQSGNENIANLTIVSAHQLKSRDLSGKTATRSEVEALRQFADDWADWIGTGAIVRLPTYGVLVHGVRTSSMDMEKFEENRTRIQKSHPRRCEKRVDLVQRHGS